MSRAREEAFPYWCCSDIRCQFNHARVKAVAKDEEWGSKQTPTTAEANQGKALEKSEDRAKKRTLFFDSWLQIKALSVVAGSCHDLLPLVTAPAKHFETSAQAINFTLTIYVIFQGISPVIFGPLSDLYCRRLLFLVTLLLYVVANVGLSLNRPDAGAGEYGAESGCVCWSRSWRCHRV
jgi:hypothetical protein